MVDGGNGGKKRKPQQQPRGGITLAEFEGAHGQAPEVAADGAVAAAAAGITPMSRFEQAF